MVCASYSDHHWFESTRVDPGCRHENPADEFAGGPYEVAAGGDDRDRAALDAVRLFVEAHEAIATQDS